MLLHDSRFAIRKVVSIDIDPRCAAIAESVNATHVRAGRFAARTADMLEIDYGPRGTQQREHGGSRDQHELRASHGVRPLVRAHPGGQPLVLQSNDYFACEQHVNCVADLAAFRAQAPMREELFAGERRMRRYVRFMLIGRK